MHMFYSWKLDIRNSKMLIFKIENKKKKKELDRSDDDNGDAVE